MMQCTVYENTQKSHIAQNCESKNHFSPILLLRSKFLKNQSKLLRFLNTVFYDQNHFNFLV